MLKNYKNYGPFEKLAKEGYYDFWYNEINKENYSLYFNSILNILKDGIETPEVQYEMTIHIHLADGEEFNFSIIDFWINLIFWTFPIYMNKPISTEHLYLVPIIDITKKSINDYINPFIIGECFKKYSFMFVNNICDECLSKFREFNTFALYISNTVNFYDTIGLMKQYPEFYNTVHGDYSGIPIEDIKNYGMEQAKIQIKYIKESDHCLSNSFRAKEAISPKQYKEVAVNIGTKPDGQGGIYPCFIDRSFITGGVDKPEFTVIDSSGGRTAQILQKMNVGTSGNFARLLETNNLDTFFNDDQDYDCGTKNFIQVFIKDETWLSMYDRRYYRIHPNGIDYVLDKYKDTDKIGQTLYFRSPITCNSYARGHGICKKCYGELYYVNRDINPGKIAAELLSSIYTQMLLSAKHLLESSAIEQKWNPEFYEIFEIEVNTISIDENVDTTGMKMYLDSNMFTSDEDDDDISTEESITSFDIKYPDGKLVHFHTDQDDNIYLTEALNSALKSKKTKEDDDGIFIIPMDILKSAPIFTIKIQNKELQRTLERSKHIIDREKDTSSFTKDEIVREFISANFEGGIHVDAVHLETIIANQMRDPDNIFEMPDWSKPNARYKILTLSSALNNSPSCTVTLEYQRIGKTLISPQATKKTKPSVYDLFFMENPQDFVVSKEMISDRYKMIEDGAKDSMTEAIYFEDEKSNDF